MTRKNIILVAVLVVIAGSIGVLEYGKARPGAVGESVALGSESAADKAGKYPQAQELAGIAGYINTGTGATGEPVPLQIADLIGKKVILVDFWTYSCINCQRTTPYLNAWYEKYRDQGLEIIGVHTPEFGFEKVYDNVQRAVAEEGIEYPVVLDNDYATWSAYQNRYWPRKYLIDIDGYIVYDHIGEGAYDETEAMIQRALAERKERLGEEGAVATGMVQPKAEEGSSGIGRSPETYFGAGRNEYLGNGAQGAVGEAVFAFPSRVETNILYLSGRWNLQPEYAESVGEGRIRYRFRARDVYMVASAPEPTRVQVLIDGKPIPADLRGSSVSVDGFVTIEEDTLYRLVEVDAFSEHTLELVIPSEGLKTYTFTFG